MKYIFFIIVAFLLVQEIPAQIRLSTMTEVTSLDTADLFWVNEFVTPNWVNRKLKWLDLRSNMIDYIDGLANTWALKQTYSSGATFSTGSNGTVDIQDSALTTGLWTNWLHARQAVTYIGSTTDPFFNVYSRNFVVVNPYENDSVYISYEDSTISFNKPLTVETLNITGGLVVPDSAQFSGLALSQATYQPTLATDSVIALTNVESSIVINPPASMGTPGIEKITMTGAGNGQVLVITNRQALTIVFQDSEADGNLYLATDFSMGQWQSLTLMYNSNIQKWLELSRSSN